MMKKKKREFPFFDDEEKDIIESWERGEWKSAKNQKAKKAEAAAMARRTLRKAARVNIRMSTADLDMLKRRAAEEGLH